MANTFKNAGVAITTSQTTLYTAPAATQSIINGLFISNVDGVNSAVVTIDVYDASAPADRKLGVGIAVPAGTTLVWDKPINLEASDALKITAGTNGDIEAFASILEIT